MSEFAIAAAGVAAAGVVGAVEDVTGAMDVGAVAVLQAARNKVRLTAPAAAM